MPAKFYFIETYGPEDLIVHEHCLPKGLSPHSLGVALITENDVPDEGWHCCDVCHRSLCPCEGCRELQQAELSPVLSTPEGRLFYALVTCQEPPVKGQRNDHLFGDPEEDREGGCHCGNNCERGPFEPCPREAEA